MIINLEALNPGTWFPLEGGGEICLRVCAGDDYRTIQAQVTKVRSEVVFDPKTRQPHRIKTEEVDDAQLRNLLWDFCIVDWRGLTDQHGTAIPCTKDMKLLFMGRAPQFSDFVTECLAKLRSLDDALSEEQAKN